MKTALLLIANGVKYFSYAIDLAASAKKHFVEHDVILFTDHGETGDPEHYPVVQYDHHGYPDASYFRYHAFWGARDIISRYDQVFYCDVDMLFVSDVTGEEIFSDGITATEHPGYVGSRGTPETHPSSRACCPQIRNYFCGGFNGGSSSAFLKMAEELQYAIDLDEKNKVRAIWVDESHLNRYLYDNPPAKILSPSFCYPEKDEYYKGVWARAGRGPFEPKLMALEKKR